MSIPQERFPEPDVAPQPVQPEIDRERGDVPPEVVDGALDDLERQYQKDDERNKPKGPVIH